MDFENASADPGGLSYAAGVQRRKPDGNNFDRSLTGGFLVHVLFMPILMFGLTPESKGRPYVVTSHVRICAGVPGN